MSPSGEQPAHDEPSTDAAGSTPIPAASARRSAMLFPIGNIIAMLIPVPLGIFWLGASMAVYTLNRHHPNPLVGEFTQRSAYRLYGVAGFVVVVATFFGTQLYLWLITWALSALIIIPLSIRDLLRIRRMTWMDTHGEETAR